MIAWIDKNRKEYRLNEITDSHLLNLLTYVYKGGGWDSFVNLESMERLYDESLKRKLNYHIGKYTYMENIRQRIVDDEYLSKEIEFRNFDWMNGAF